MGEAASKFPCLMQSKLLRHVVNAREADRYLCREVPDLVARLAVVGLTEVTCRREVVRRALGQQNRRVVRRGRRPLATEKDGPLRGIPALFVTTSCSRRGGSPSAPTTLTEMSSTLPRTGS